jgi:hypothetical protein
MKFKHLEVNVPKHDCDVDLVMPTGERITIQFRPSNGDIGYEGSLDIILPEDMEVTCWEGDDMQAAKGVRGQAHTRIAKQLVLELPGIWHDDGLDKKSLDRLNQD